MANIPGAPARPTRGIDSAQDKGVVVTGGGNGIGRALAIRLAEEGAHVVVNDLDASAAEEVASHVGGICIPADLGTPEGPEQLVTQSIEALSRIDIFCGNAGIAAGGSIETDDADWARALNVNLMAHVRAARALVPHWLNSGGGHYIVTASAAGLLTMIGNGPYSVSKHAAVAFAEWLDIEYGNRGISAQAVCPQGVDSQMLRNSGAVEQLLSRDTALPPDAVAAAVVTDMQAGRFLTLPHPEVADYYAARATDTDRWLHGMRHLHNRTFHFTGSDRR
ncbi:SDR family oxidoreductase [Saccharopolyspora mangrovi]|uniref:SDR family oxidoreductase n=1 Tax=Saccharopolyspora mangrovi TaxID=3082379 RepID=A0ABU6AJS9_9PSEU|nr:SDR family oxidoreductase [Saccharopolyspora sp. S2-29]MEB3371766.1 SDR family oxidoreductase [Saccharopolyspora sp. S2-29]